MKKFCVWNAPGPYENGGPHMSGNVSLPVEWKIANPRRVFNIGECSEEIAKIPHHLVWKMVFLEDRKNFQGNRPKLGPDTAEFLS